MPRWIIAASALCVVVGVVLAWAIRPRPEAPLPKDRVELLRLYEAWSRESERAGDRRRVLVALAAGEAGLEAVLDAVAADPTPPEKDPMWNTARQALVDRMKQASSLDEGRALLYLERRLKARRLLVAALTDAVPEHLAPHLASDLIRLAHRDPDPSLRADILSSIAHLAGPSVASSL